MTGAVGWRTLGSDLVSLRLFLAIAEEGSLALAAARENIALSAASRRISALEARLGITLFERRERGLTLSWAGEDLLGRVRDVFALLERVALDAEALRAGVLGHVRIQAHISASALGLPQRIAQFLAAHPGIDVELEERTSFEIIHSVRTGMTDLGFVSGAVESPGIELIPWQWDELVAVVPAGHALADRESLSLAEMLQFPFVMMQRESALLALVREHAKTFGGQLRVRAHAATFESAVSMVASGLGVALLPAPALQSVGGIANVCARPLSESWAKRRLTICLRDRDRLNAAARMFLEELIPSLSPPTNRVLPK